MKKPVRRLLSSTLVFLVTTSIVLSALAPLTLPQSLQAQTNPQTTDIFTGQFIPAYFGSAYDPSEAYKRMAGATVYVFGYDSWGRVVNDFAYRTQIKADGSFQAAGLPNASHYGVFFPNGGNNSLEPTSNQHIPFRSPKPEDQLQTAFAYQQATFPDTDPEDTNEPEPPRTQINNERIDGEDGRDEIRGQSVFLTSSRSVDIDNHINIFPLVPTTVLSVTIQDGAPEGGQAEAGNQNVPYEIFAQRVVNDLSEETGGEISALSYVTKSPIIRGRTVYTSEMVPVGGGDENPIGGDDEASQPMESESAALFQAYAPPGIYAITYWRPDTRDVNQQITYLNYDGEVNLRADWNGLAMEQVGFEAYSEDDIYGWSAKIEAPIADRSWTSVPGSTNLWGIITMSQDSRDRPYYGASVNLHDSALRKVTLFGSEARTCSSSNASEFTTSTNGIYFFTNACPDNTGYPVNLSTTASITVHGPGNNAGSPAARSKLHKVSIGDKSGPARRDVRLEESGASSGQSSISIFNEGVAYRDVQVDLFQNGKKIVSLGRPDNTGRVYIDPIYFQRNLDAEFTLKLNPDFPTVAGFTTRKYNLSGISNYDWSQGALAFEPINLHKPTSTFTTTLASLSLENILNNFTIRPAFAQTQSCILDPNTDQCADFTNRIPMTSSGGGSGNQWLLRIDDESVYQAIELNGFTKDAWKIDKLELRPEDVQPNGMDIGLRANADPCTIGNSDQNPHEGYWLAGDGDDPYGEDISANDGPKRIVGFRLICETDKYDSYYGLNNIFDATELESMNFRLHAVIAQRDPEQTEANQEQVLPTHYTTGDEGFPITITRVGGEYSTSTTAITMVPKYGQCEYGDKIGLNGFMPDINIGAIIMDIGCTLVSAAIAGINKVFGMITDRFITVDPIGSTLFGGLPIKFWNIIRNFVNALSVLILVAAGIAIMLRYEPNTFRLQTVLRKLIITIVAVNFSVLIMQVFVDIANVLAYGGYHYLTSVLDEPAAAVSGAGVTAGLLGYVALAMASAVVSGLGGFVMIVFGIFFLVILMAYVGIKIAYQYFLRLVVLLICIIIAPAAIAATILPGTSKYFSKWKNMFIGALVGQVALAMVLALSFTLLNSFAKVTSFSESILMLVAALALFYMATILPNKAAAMAGTDMASGIESFGKSIAAWSIKSARGQGPLKMFNQLERARRSSEREGEDAMRDSLDMGKLSRVQRFNRVRRQFGLGGGASATELLEAEEKARQSGQKTAIRSFDIEGEDPDEVLRSELIRETTALHPDWSQEQIEQSVNNQMTTRAPRRRGEVLQRLRRRGPIYRDAGIDARRTAIADRVRHAPEIRHEAEVEASRYKDLERIADNIRGGLSMPKSKTDLYGQFGKFNTYDGDAIVADAGRIAARNNSTPTTSDLKPIYEFLVANGADFNTYGDVKTWLTDARKSALADLAVEHYGFTPLNIQRNEHIDLLWGVVSDISGDPDKRGKATRLRSGTAP